MRARMMNRKAQTVLVCLLVVALLALIVLSSCSPITGRQKWKYRVVSVNPPASEQSTQAQLNQLGSEGWDCSFWIGYIVCKRSQ